MASYRLGPAQHLGTATAEWTSDHGREERDRQCDCRMHLVGAPRVIAMISGSWWDAGTAAAPLQRLDLFQRLGQLGGERSLKLGIADRIGRDSYHGRIDALDARRDDGRVGG